MLDIDAFKDLFDSLERDNLNQLRNLSRSLSSEYDDVNEVLEKLNNPDGNAQQANAPLPNAGGAIPPPMPNTSLNTYHPPANEELRHDEQLSSARSVTLATRLVMNGVREGLSGTKNAT
jgi:hypothetical protein